MRFEPTIGREIDTVMERVCSTKMNEELWANRSESMAGTVSIDWGRSPTLENPSEVAETADLKCKYYQDFGSLKEGVEALRDCGQALRGIWGPVFSDYAPLYFIDGIEEHTEDEVNFFITRKDDYFTHVALTMLTYALVSAYRRAALALCMKNGVCKTANTTEIAEHMRREAVSCNFIPNATMSCVAELEEALVTLELVGGAYTSNRRSRGKQSVHNQSCRNTADTERLAKLTDGLAHFNQLCVPTHEGIKATQEDLFSKLGVMMTSFKIIDPFYSSTDLQLNADEISLANGAPPLFINRVVALCIRNIHPHMRGARVLMMIQAIKALGSVMMRNSAGVGLAYALSRQDSTPSYLTSQRNRVSLSLDEMLDNDFDLVVSATEIYQ